MNKFYICIDLKSFYASVECVERKMDPFLTNLVVADSSRGKGAICLAVSPKMKENGVANRCRLYEIPHNLSYIIALPRMKKYIEYSANIYEIYLNFFAKEDIHVYSIDEVFIDISNYLTMYKKTPIEIAKMLISEVYKKTKITATVGIGTNLYLAKIALDILAKHTSSNIAFLDEKLYIDNLHYHEPLSDFWQIGQGIERRLEKLGIYNMHDLVGATPEVLYKEFGINAKLLLDHAKGIEPTTIEQIKNYKPKTTSISTSQIFFEDYDFKNTKKVVLEMIDYLCLELIKKGAKTALLYLKISYSKNILKPTRISKKLKYSINDYKSITDILLTEYTSKVVKDVPIRKISLAFLHLTNNESYQFNFFDNNLENSKGEKLDACLNFIKEKYGKNVILKAISYTEKATARKRNTLIGGHNAI